MTLIIKDDWHSDWAVHDPHSLHSHMDFVNKSLFYMLCKFQDWDGLIIIINKQVLSNILGNLYVIVQLPKRFYTSVRT